MSAQHPRSAVGRFGYSAGPPEQLPPEPRPIRCIWLLGDAVRIPRMPKDSSRPVASGSRAMSPTTATVPRSAHATTHPPREKQAVVAVRARSLREPALCRGPTGTVCCPGRRSRRLNARALPPLDVAHPAIRNSLALVRSPNPPDQRRGVSAILPALPTLLTPKPRPIRCIWLLGGAEFNGPSQRSPSPVTVLRSPVSVALFP